MKKAEGMRCAPSCVTVPPSLLDGSLPERIYASKRSRLIPASVAASYRHRSDLLRTST
jgi:hypothetical protein